MLLNCPFTYIYVLKGKGYNYMPLKCINCGRVTDFEFKELPKPELNLVMVRRHRDPLGVSETVDVIFIVCDHCLKETMEGWGFPKKCPPIANQFFSDFYGHNN